MRLIRNCWIAGAVWAGLILLIADSAAQRNAEPQAPTATGKVVGYEADKSITLEVGGGRVQAKKVEFAIVKDKTKIELPPRQKELKVGMVVAVWADKDNPKNAARIGLPPAGGGVRPGQAQPDAPTATGKVVAYEADKSITLEVGGGRVEAKKVEFAIVKDKTKIELPPRQKELKVGMVVAVWADKDNPTSAARITAGTLARGGGGLPPAPPNPARPKEEPNKQPDKPATSGTATLPPAVDKNKGTGNAQAQLAVARLIDKDIGRTLAANKVPPSGQADDAEFLRRVYLDITGRLPPLDKTLAFLDSKDLDKRAKLIDELLASKEYGLHFADLWCDRINAKDMPIHREPFVGWLSDSLNQGRGWDEVVLEQLTAGGNFGFITRGNRLRSDEPQALFLLLNTEEGTKGPNPAWLAAESSRLFLGVQIQCAECHDHPFTESWKQTDFWGLAGFFSKLRMENDKSAKGTPLKWQETPPAADITVSMKIPATALKNIGKIVPARLPSGDPEKPASEYRSSDQQLLRHTLARWMTTRDNPFFARGTVNWIWAQFFGRGLVNPVDDLRADNPPSHPAIMQLLADEFTKSGFELKYLIRCICLSQAYQRTSVPPHPSPSPSRGEEEGVRGDDANYSHMAVKVMGPGVLYDSLKMATGLAELKVGIPERKTKLTVLALFTPREVFVDFFRAAQGAEANPLENNHGIPQTLKLMNAAQLNGITPVVQRLAGSGQSSEQVVEQLYLTTLVRRPSAAEAKLIADFLARRKDAAPMQGYSAVLWTLINSAEFVSNH